MLLVKFMTGPILNLAFISEKIKDGVLLIANPGTGKTTQLANKVIELLEKGVAAENILCLTFTEKASAEMRERIEEKIRDKKIKVDIRTITISTFHSYAFNSILDHGQEYNILGNNIMRFLIYKSFEENKSLNYSKETIISNIVPKVENAIRYIKSFGITIDKINIDMVKKELREAYIKKNIKNITLLENLKFLEYFLKAYDTYESRRPHGFIDYNDMLIKFLMLEHKKKYEYVLVDELQDVNGLEASIALSSGEHIFLVGDRKQSIFGFQGGSIRNFNFFIDSEKIEKKKLDINYRSGQKILDYAKAQFLQNTKDQSYETELKDLKSYKHVESVLKLISTNDATNAAIIKAVELLNKNEKVAIITRTNNQILKISKILDSKGISYSTTTSSETSETAKNEILKFLRGVLYDDLETVIHALFTPFSGMSLQEAFTIGEKYNNGTRTLEKLKNYAKPFFDIKNRVQTLPDLIDLFEKTILPISISINKDYYVTAKSLAENINEFIKTFKTYTREDLFNYLAVTDESYQELGESGNLVLTTVHKAKGREFENVIYLPSVTSARYSFIDIVAYSIIKAVSKIDVWEELEEEPLRIDFVAFTRAKRGLFIIIDKNKLLNRYDIGSIQKSNIIADTTIEPLPKKYNEAYSLFVNKRYELAKKALTASNHWLRDTIKHYFSNISTLSYSLISSANDPYNFLIKNIIGMPIKNKSIELGTKVHTMAHRLFKNTINEKELTSEIKIYLNNIKAISEQIKQTYNAVQISSEEVIELNFKRIFEPVSTSGEVELLPSIKKEDLIKFKAKLDAVYKTKDEKYIIVDYKTDKTESYARSHRKQLALYKRLYAIKHKINEDNIITAIAFIGLRGMINTEKIEFKLDVKQPSSKYIKTFQEQTEKFLNYIKEPEKFIEDLINSKTKGLLYDRIISILK